MQNIIHILLWNLCFHNLASNHFDIATHMFLTDICAPYWPFLIKLPLWQCITPYIIGIPFSIQKLKVSNCSLSIIITHIYQSDQYLFPEIPRSSNTINLLGIISNSLGYLPPYSLFISSSRLNYMAFYLLHVHYWFSIDSIEPILLYRSFIDYQYIYIDLMSTTYLRSIF